jgi:hypothetical protein
MDFGGVMSVKLSMEREDGSELRRAVFFLDGARIVGRAKAEFQLVHGVLLVMSAR